MFLVAYSPWSTWRQAGTHYYRLVTDKCWGSWAGGAHTGENVADPSMLLLLVLVWYHTAHLVALSFVNERTNDRKYFFAEIPSSETKPCEIDIKICHRMINRMKMRLSETLEVIINLAMFSDMFPGANMYKVNSGENLLAGALYDIFHFL